MSEKTNTLKNVEQLAKRTFKPSELWGEPYSYDFDENPRWEIAKDITYFYGNVQWDIIQTLLRLKPELTNYNWYLISLLTQRLLPESQVK